MKTNRLIIYLFSSLLLILSCQKEADIFNPDVEYGSMSDIEENRYRTVQIGNQVWMAENLRTTRYKDGTEIYPGNETSKWSAQKGSYCWYDNDKRAHKQAFGALYNWTAVKTGSLCPDGWHVPGIEEWETLVNYLIDNGYNYDGTTSENKIAQSLAASARWEPGTETGTPGNSPSDSNDSGFSALPSGYRDPTHGWNTFQGIGVSCGWWSSTQNGDFALHTSLSNQYTFLHADDPEQISTVVWSYGFSVRCVKD